MGAIWWSVRTCWSAAGSSEQLVDALNSAGIVACEPMPDLDESTGEPVLITVCRLAAAATPREQDVADAAPRFVLRYMETPEPYMPVTDDTVADAVRAALSDDLLKSRWQNQDRPFSGHCYVASECYYHLNGGREGGWTPQRTQHEGSPHWWLRHDDGRIIDLTAEQFETPVPYDQGRGGGFLTREPSQRAQMVLSRIQRVLSY